MKPVRPGAGKKRKARSLPKGRQVQPEARQDIARLLGKATSERTMLIEHLHLIQDKWGHISAAHLAALAEHMHLSQAEVYEVATFYHHFDVIKEGECAPPEVTVRVCNSLSCALAGADKLHKALKDKAPKYVRVVHAPCMGLCDQAPAACVGRNYQGNATPAGLLQAARARDVKPHGVRCERLRGYQKKGGYKILQNLRKGGQTPDGVARTLLDAGLCGRVCR